MLIIFLFPERLDQDDGCHMERTNETVDHVSLNTGLRKTYYSGTLYGAKKPAVQEMPVRTSPERVIQENNDSPSKSLRNATTVSPKSTIRNRSASRIPHSPVRNRTPTRANTPSPKHTASSMQTSPKMVPKLPPTTNNTWNGRSAPNQARSKVRPSIATDTFENPNKSSKAKTNSVTQPQSQAFQRNSQLRASSATLRSPTKHKIPLLEQIFTETKTAKDEATVVEKVKQILKAYYKTDDSLSRSSSKDSSYDDFISDWVMSNGKLERSASTRQLASPRKDPRIGPSRIPAPVAIGCRRSTSTTQFQ